MTRLIPLLTSLFLTSVLPATAADTSLEGLQKRIVGHWKSIACELRPQQNETDPKLAPSASYLKRDFVYGANGKFEANITVFADSACAVPAVSYDFAGEVKWHDRNPAIDGAWSQDYVLNQKLELTVLAPPIIDKLKVLPDGACVDGNFVLGEKRDILGKPCVLLKFVEGSKFVVDHDFLFVSDSMPDLLFMGAKHVDGTGFYSPENRPMVGLQQPLARVK